MSTQQRIRRIWSNNGHTRRRYRGNILSGGDTSSTAQGVPVYPGSSVTELTSDFLGDWRSADGWMRFDMWRVRNRSRQLERGNPWCIAFKRNMLNNILGYKGFHWKPNVVTGGRFGDTSDGVVDEAANLLIKDGIDEFGKKENFTTRKKLSRRMADRLLLSRIMFDGEVIIRKIRGFDNDFNFTWQIINPDYLDHNLNKTMDNGNIVKMGVEFDATYKFPVAYHILKRRPNDYFYNYAQLDENRYYRVLAEEIIHMFICTEDDEQTRGWPWIFSAVITLFRMGRYEEAALVNATIGASRGVYFEKKFPEGWMGDPKEMFEEDSADMTLDLPSGSSLELPWGVEAKSVDMRYPDGEYKDFHNSMLLTSGATFGTSYATTTGDLSQANFVSSRLGQIEEQEHYKNLQEFWIEHWKQPGFDEELFRAILARKITLPIARFDKFNKAEFAGRRWKFVQPIDDMRAKELQMNNLVTAVSDVIAETTQEDTEEVFKRIAKDNELMAKYGLKRLTTPTGSAMSTDASDQPESPVNPINPDDPSIPKPPVEKKIKKRVD